MTVLCVCLGCCLKYCIICPWMNYVSRMEYLKSWCSQSGITTRVRRSPVLYFVASCSVYFECMSVILDFELKAVRSKNTDHAAHICMYMAARPLFDSFLLNTQASLCPRWLQMACTQLCAGPLQSTSAWWLWSYWIGVTQYPEAKVACSGLLHEPTAADQDPTVFCVLCSLHLHWFGCMCPHVVCAYVSSIHPCLKLLQFHLFWMIGLDTQVVFTIMCLKQLQFHLLAMIGIETLVITMCLTPAYFVCVKSSRNSRSHSELNNNRQKKK